MYTDVMRNKSKNLNVRMTPDELEKVKWLSNKLNKSQGEVIVTLVDREVKRINKINERKVKVNDKAIA